MKVLAVQDHSIVYDTRALLKHWEREPEGHNLVNRCGLLAKRATCGCPHLHRGHDGRAGRSDGSEHVRNTSGAYIWGVASGGGCGVP